MINNALSRTVTVQIVSTPFQGMSSIACPDCDLQLNLAQPDPHSAARLLGTCGECSGWFLVELSSDAGTVRVVSLAPIARLANGVRLGPRWAGA